MLLILIALFMFVYCSVTCRTLTLMHYAVCSLFHAQYSRIVSVQGKQLSLLSMNLARTIFDKISIAYNSKSEKR